MAEVDKVIRTGKGKGRQLQQAMGLVDNVQSRLRLEAVLGAFRAEANLKTHRVSGDSYISTESGRVDHYVILNDERGQGAAMSIEYGRKGLTDKEVEEGVTLPSGSSEGLFILHDAMKFSRGSGDRPSGRESLDE